MRLLPRPAFSLAFLGRMRVPGGSGAVARILSVEGRGVDNSRAPALRSSRKALLPPHDTVKNKKLNLLKNKQALT